MSGGGSGSMTLRQATANSVNTVFAQLGIDVGPENFAEMAKKIGVTSPLDGFYAEALGGTSTCCTVLEMSNAYATLANGGVHHDPTAIEKVVFPNGEVDEPKDPEGNRVISDGVAYTVADVMQGTLDYGTAVGYDISCTASGKTGTTEEQADAWFVGYTPDVSTAVWTGHANDRTPVPGYGADLSAPIWHDYMEAYIAETGNCDDYPEPKEPAELSSYSSDQTIESSDYERRPRRPRRRRRPTRTPGRSSRRSPTASTPTATAIPTTPTPRAPTRSRRPLPRAGSPAT